MPQNPPEGCQRLIPYLTYADAPAAIEFLCKAFGFAEKMRFPMPDGKIGHAELSLDDNVVFLASVYEELGFQSPRDLGAVTSQTMVYVDDVDAHHARAASAGATISARLEDQFYGDRTYRAIDPEGHRWIFATHVRDVPPEEMVPPS